MFCPKCGCKNKEGAKFCSSCGAALANREAAPVDSGQASAGQSTSAGVDSPSPSGQEILDDVEKTAGEVADKASVVAGEVAGKAEKVASEVADKATVVAGEVADKAGVVFNDVKAKAAAGSKDISAAVGEYKKTGYFKYEKELYYILDVLLIVLTTAPLFTLTFSANVLSSAYATMSGSFSLFTLSGVLGATNSMLSDAVKSVAQITSSYGYTMSANDVLAQYGISLFSPWDFVLWLVALVPIFCLIYNILQHKAGKQSIVGGAAVVVLLVVVFIVSNWATSQIRTILYSQLSSDAAYVNFNIAPSWIFWLTALVAAVSIAVNMMKFKKLVDAA